MTTSSPMLALAPGTTTVPGTGANTGPDLLPRHPPPRLAAHRRRSRCSSPTAACAATSTSPAPAARGRWIPAASPSCLPTAPGTTAPPPGSTSPGSAATATRSATWHGPPRKTGCANHSSPPAPGSSSPTTSAAPSTNLSASASWTPACRSFRSCKAGRSPTTCAAPTCYERRGINLTAEPLVGLGSVCRRQATAEVHTLITALRERGITRLHGFGFKIAGPYPVAATCWPPPTRWPGPSPPAATPRCPAARPGTSTAPTAPATPTSGTTQYAPRSPSQRSHPARPVQHRRRCRPDDHLRRLRAIVAMGCRYCASPGPVTATSAGSITSGRPPDAPTRPPARRPADHRSAHRRTPALGLHPRHARPGDLQSVRQPPHRGLPVLRRDLPPRRLPAHPLRPHRRQRRPRNRRHPPGRVRHLHRPLVRPVHTRAIRHHTCTDRARCTCRPEPCHARRDATTCEHGQPTGLLRPS